MFPGAGARVYYNDAGEPLGWDYPSDDGDPGDPYDDYDDRDVYDDEEEEDEAEDGGPLADPLAAEPLGQVLE